LAFSEADELFDSAPKHSRFLRGGGRFVTDDENDKMSNAQANNPGAGKDVLFGWLVGRAAADLGLAQALAASEAQRAEQFKRLEDSLLAQIRELQNRNISGSDSAVQAIELGDVKAEIRGIFERMGGLEAATQQFADMPEVFRTEVAALQIQWNQRQSGLETQRSEFEKIAESLAARVRELESQINSRPQGLDGAQSDLTNLKLELGALAQRMARAETSAQQIQTETGTDIQRAQELAADLIRAESITLKAAIFERLDHQPSPEAVVGGAEKRLQSRVDDVRHELGEQANKFTGLIDELSELRTRLQSLTARVESTPAVVAPAVDYDAESVRLSQEASERIGAAMREFGDEIRPQLQGVHDFNINLELLNAEIVSLAARIANIERVTEQIAAGFRRELDSVKTELYEKHNRQPAVQALLNDIEQSLSTKIQECQDSLIQERQRFQAREVQYHEVATNLEHLVQRMTETESMIHQTHALMVNETVQIAQQRDGVTAELATLRAQVGDSQAREAAFRGIEDRLNVKIHELQNQLGERMASLDRRDADLRELKAQVQSFIRQMTTPPAGMRPSNVSVPNQMQESAPIPLDTGTRVTPVEDRLRAVLPRSEGAQQRPQAVLRPGGEPEDQLLVEGADQLRVLQARMSADIERARAELKEKSGRWKVRR